MVDVTDATFETEVLARSEQVPVVVDLWADWCGPCKTLGPIIERVVAATNGEVVLAKIDVDANPRTAQAFQAQSIPAVHAIRDRQVVDSFLGAQPEAVVQEFVDRLRPDAAPSEVDLLVAAGDEASLRAALEIEADHEAAVVALALLLGETDRVDEGLELLERLGDTAEARRAAGVLRTAGVEGDIPAELERLLGSVKSDDDARQRFVDLLERLGPDDPRTADYRRRLTTALY